MAESSILAGDAAGKFAADVTALLPFALPELQKLGVMKVCAHCGKSFNDGVFVVHIDRDQDGFFEASILALCKADRENLTISPKDWPHFPEGSGLFPTEREWEPLIRNLRYCAMVTILKVHGGIALAAITSNPEVPDLMKGEES